MAVTCGSLIDVVLLKRDAVEKATNSDWVQWFARLHRFTD